MVATSHTASGALKTEIVSRPGSFRLPGARTRIVLARVRRGLRLAARRDGRMTQSPPRPARRPTLRYILERRTTVKSHLAHRLIFFALLGGLLALPLVGNAGEGQRGRGKGHHDPDARLQRMTESVNLSSPRLRHQGEHREHGTTARAAGVWPGVASRLPRWVQSSDPAARSRDSYLDWDLRAKGFVAVCDGTALSRSASRSCVGPRPTSRPDGA